MSAQNPTVPAAAVTWAANRHWTFRHARTAPAGAQWMRFLGANLFGFALNRGVYAALIWGIPVCKTHPIIAIAAGSLAGMLVNFHLSQRLVFRRQ